jgi:hypothetical protein
MSSMELDQTALTEVDAASAANNDGKEIVMSDEEDRDYSENDEELIDYNEQEELEAAIKATELMALKEMLTTNGRTLRDILRSEKVKTHYVSPFSEEDAMSIEDILGEIPKEDLHEVGTVQRRIFMPASFVQKWVIPTIRAREALKEHGTGMPGGIETAMLFSIFDQSTLNLTKSRQQPDKEAYSLRALVTCAQNANTKLIERMRKGNDGIKNIARASLKQLEQVVQMPSLDTMYTWNELDYDFYHDRIADAIK